MAQRVDEQDAISCHELEIVRYGLWAGSPGSMMPDRRSQDLSAVSVTAICGGIAVRPAAESSLPAAAICADTG